MRVQSIVTVVFIYFLWDWLSIKDCFNTHTDGIILITDTSSGRHAAFELALNNFTVFCGVRTPSDMELLKDEAQNRSLENFIIPVLLDVTNKDHIKDVYDQILSFKSFNSTENLKFIGLINNAGLSEYCPLEAYPLSRIRNIFEINFWSSIILTQRFLPVLRQNQGRVIFVTSILGYNPLVGTSIESATKNALEGVIDTLRLEIKSFGIAVVSIIPGKTNSNTGKKTEISSFIYSDIYELYKYYFTKEPFSNIGPEVTSKAILQSMTLSCPNSRYFVGDSVTFDLLVNALLPDRLLDLLKL